MKIYLLNLLAIIKRFREIPLYLLPMFALLIYVFVEFCLRMQYELSGPFTWDTGLYWAVGRGIVNGITPWSGLWETKPPGIFLLGAISYKIFGTSILTHYVQSLVLIIIAVIPILSHFIFPNCSVWRFIICALFGFAISLYAAERSGEVQIESFGAAFGCIAVFAFSHPNFYKRKKMWIAVSALGILGACGLKEPFLFPIFGASVLLCKDLKDWYYRFLLPLIIAMAAGFLLLLIFGWLGDFLHYLDFMRQFWVNRFGSPYKRAMQFWRLWEDMNGFSWGLGWVFVTLLFAPFVLYKNYFPNMAVKILIAFLLTSYTVGLGGEFYNHHHVFAVPFYFALLAMLLNAEKFNETSGLLGVKSLLFVLLSVAVLNLPNLNLDKRAKEMKHTREEQLKEAAYIDAVLDKAGLKRYMYLGRNGNHVYGWTKHSPEGPYFIQYEEWVRDIPEFKTTVLSMLMNSQVAVMGWIQSPVKDAVQPILDEYFTLEPWDNVADIPRPLRMYNIYFRKR